MNTHGEKKRRMSDALFRLTKFYALKLFFCFFCCFVFITVVRMDCFEIASLLSVIVWLYFFASNNTTLGKVFFFISSLMYVGTLILKKGSKKVSNLYFQKFA